MKKFALLPLTILFPVVTQAATLREAITQTIYHNPEVTVITHQRRAADQEVKQAQAGYLPSVDLIGSYGREHTDSASNSPETNSLWARRAGVGFEQPIFSGFSTPNEVFRTKAKANAEAYQLAGTAQDFALDVSESYLYVLRDQALVDISKRRLETHQRIYKMIEQRGLSGLSRKAETNQVATRLEAAQADYYASMSNLTDQETAYHRLTGVMPEELAEPPQPTKAMLPKTEEELIQTALSRDNIVRSAYQDIQEAKGQAYAARAPYWPTVNVVAGVNRNNNIGGIDGQDDDEFALVEASYNIFNGGADHARARETAEQYQEALDIHRNSMRQAIEKAKLSWNAYVNTQREMEPLRKRQEQAEKTVNAYMEQYRLGKRTLVDLLNAEADKYNAESDYAENLYRYKLSLYRLLNSEDKLLQFFQVPLPKAATEVYRLPGEKKV